MLKNREVVGSNIFLFGLVLMAIGLPLSKFLMTISQFIMAAGWFYSGDIKNKFKIFFTNKAALLTSSIVLIHIVGLAYTDDMKYGWEDVRKKVPILVYAILLSSGPKLSIKNVERVLGVFVASVIISSLISIAVLLGYINKPLRDIRDISIFISHIRLSLLVCISVIICMRYVIVLKTNYLRIVNLISSCWLIVFLIILESLTGLLILFIVFAITYSYYAFKRQGLVKKIIHFSVILLLSFPIAWYLNNQLSDYYKGAHVTMSDLEPFTAKGNPYVHNFINRQKENGNYVWHYVCEKEVVAEWPERCGTPFSGVDGKNNPMKITIYRYLTSKGLRKDSVGVHSLTGEDIILIEQGITNYKYKETSSLAARIYQVIWEIDNYVNNNNPSGHSITQRVEFWKAAWGIIKDNPLIGVGTGDPILAFEKQYEKMNSPLAEEWRLRSHNQYLAVTVALGFTGLGCFLFAFFYPFVVAFKKNNYLYVLFFIVAFLSMLTEDTLETQAGVSFYIFFHCLFFYHPTETKK